MGKAKLSMGQIEDFVDQHLQSYQEKQPEFENNRYSHCEITQFSQNQYSFDLVAGLLKQKGLYISFCIQNRNDAI